MIRRKAHGPGHAPRQIRSGSISASRLTDSALTHAEPPAARTDAELPTASRIAARRLRVQRMGSKVSSAPGERKKKIDDGVDRRGNGFPPLRLASVHGGDCSGMGRGGKVRSGLALCPLAHRGRERFSMIDGSSSRPNWLPHGAFLERGLVHAVDDRGLLVLAESRPAGGEDRACSPRRRRGPCQS